MRITIAICAAAIGILATAAKGQQLINVNLTGSGGSGSFGNTRSWTQSGVTLTATGWGYTKGAGNTAFETAALGQWSTGLGVANRDEGATVGNPEHQVDNNGATDYVLFLFSTPVDYTSVVIDPTDTWDRDVQYWVGSVSNPLNLTDKTYANLSSLGFLGGVIDLGTVGSASRTVTINGPEGVNALLIGAPNTNADGNIDRFKITSVSAVVVPEPGSAMLLLLGATAGFLRRRRA